MSQTLNIRQVTMADHAVVCRLIDDVNLPPRLFIKNTPLQTAKIIKDNRSLLCEVGRVAIGVVLVSTDNYIDTIVSYVRGTGRQLLSNLPAGEYQTHISPDNERSIAMFTAMGFEEIGTSVLEQQKRYVYAGSL